MTRYRTIVADPPWEHAPGGPRKDGAGNWSPKSVGNRQGVPYGTLTVEQIAALPVKALAESDAHLYLWTTNAFLRRAYDVVEAWGFKPSTLLTWCKAPMGIGLGGAYTVTTEHVLFARRGSLAPLRRWDTTWFNFKRPHGGNGKFGTGGGPIHSAKPDGFLDVVEQVSPGPYVELFARRARFGWDYYGDESLGTAEMAA
jgi:N6-adenosine-specific RNA methylase IME4